MAEASHDIETSEQDTQDIVEIDNLLKEFRDDNDNPVTAVDNLNLSIQDGEFIVFVGPSGCGKTTTLRCIAGLESPTDGKIVIDGVDVTGLDPRQRGIAMVFQNYALYPHKSVRENIAFPLHIRNVPADTIDRRVQETVDILDIADLLDRKPDELSGGQQQRVAIGRAIVRDASVFLFDEPLSNLDAKLRMHMRTELNKIHERIGKTTIYVTHDQEEAMTLGDRIAVLYDGRLQQVGTPEEVYQDPVNRFVAGFIGEPAMNFVSADIQKEGDSWAIRTEMFDVTIPDRIAAQYAVEEWAQKQLTFGIRPEDIHDDRTDSDVLDQAVSFRATPRVIEPIGPNIYLTFTDEQDQSGLEFTARLSAESSVSKSETAELHLNLHNMHIFDDETGENLTITSTQ